MRSLGSRLIGLAAYGAERIRVQPREAHALESVVATLRAHCTTFVTSPGLNSLYLMSQETPPTWENVSGLPWEWDDRAQERMVDHLERLSGLCAVDNPTIVSIWLRGHPLPDLPLLRFIDEDFHTISDADGFAVGVLRENPRARATTT